MKIRIKLFFFFSILLISAIVATTWISSSSLLNEIKQNKIHEVGKVADHRHQLLLEHLLTNQQNAQNFLARIILLCTRDKITNHLDSSCVIKRIQLQIKQDNANGAIFRQNKTKIDWVVGKIKKPHISINDFSKEQIVVFQNRGSSNIAQPYYVMAQDHELGIEIFFEYPISTVQEIFRPRDDLGKSGETFLVDKNGFFITEMRYHSHQGTHQGTEQGIYTNPMINCLKKNNAEVLDLDYREEPIIHGFRYIPEIGGGCIMAHIEQSEAFAPLRLMKKKIIALAAIIMTISLAVIFIFADYITKPLSYLANMAELVANGDEDLQSQLRQKDEIGVLSNKINQMLLSIKENREVLAHHQQTIFESSKLNAMGEMAKGVAHEINSPLAAIILGAELIEHKNAKLAEPSTHIAKLAKSISEAATRIDIIVQGLKGIARDAKDDQQEAFSARHLINTSLNLCSEMLKINKIDLIILEDHLDIILHGNETLLAQCLLNLIKNSYEAISSFEKQWIQISVTVSDNMIELRIKDSGDGISNEIQKKMFRPMFTTKTIGSGPGLGLSMSRSIVTNFGGDIIYDENSDHTCFIMKLPYS